MPGRRRHSAAAPDAPAAATGLAAILAHFPGLAWAADADLCCQFTSAAAATRFGLRAGAPVAAALPGGADAASFLAAHRRALAGASQRMQLAIAGTSLSCRLEPVRDGAGRPIGVVGSAVDTTERDRAARIVETQLRVFAATLEHVPEGIGICDASGRFLYVNAAGRRFAELEVEGARVVEDGSAVWGQWYDERGPVGPEDWPITRALQGEIVSPREFYKVRADGSRLDLQFAAAPLRDEHGAIIGAAVSSLDITARRRAEEEVRALNQQLERRVQARTTELEDAVRARDREAAERLRAMDLLARNEQLLRDVLDHSTAVIFLKDLDGRYLLINRHYERLFGVTNAEWVGRTDDALFSREVAEALRANDRQVQETGIPLHLEEVVPTLGVERTYISVKFPLRDRDGSIYGICGVATDITERKEMEAALRRSEATLASIIESCSDPIVAVSRDWQLVAMNDATARLIPALIGSLPPTHAPLGAIPEDFAGQWRGLLQRGMTGERFTVERTLPVDGAARQFLVSFNPTVQDGTVTGVAIFGREITDLKRAEEEVRQHQAELAHVLRLHTMGEMAASLAHEVNQPLGAIAAYAQGCRNRLQATNITHAELLATVEAIAREALRAGEITRRVREILRKEEAQRAIVDAGDVVRAALGIVAATASRHLVHVAARLPPTPLPVHVDQIQIEQVVVNLVLNAIDATAVCPEPRSVELRAAVVAQPQPVIEIAVSDSGAGIDPRLEQRIFEPFLTTKQGGLGMGLAISRSIVAAHGGRLWYTPNPGGGTTFHFTLPAAGAA